ncbi:MAG: serine acetyltransferase [Planctomycetota bacterium]|jgi:serine O-acetyltransferase|nr:serine acetyltransferase [Planctomycetota bacterium]
MGENGLNEISVLVERLIESSLDNQAVNHRDGHDLPDKGNVELTLNLLLSLLFPGYANGKALAPASLPYYFGDILTRLRNELPGLIERALIYDCRRRNGRDADCEASNQAVKATMGLLEALPELRETLKGDTQAAYERDPAADNLDLILFCYPGLEAVATFRLAHALHRQGVPIIPRVWTERAHSRTGIDIHPGARIGQRFFIDHGTGVVIGETTWIGDDVTLYQGVTLGALSPASGKSGRKMKRHPTIEDGVIIYANATILGGETVIGRNSVIGGSVWLTDSVPPDTVVTLSNPDLVFEPRSSGS